MEAGSRRGRKLIELLDYETDEHGVQLRDGRATAVICPTLGRREIMGRASQSAPGAMRMDRKMVVRRWRIVETEMWDREALDLVVPAHITFDRGGLGEMQLIAIGASVDYRLEDRGGVPVVEF